MHDIRATLDRLRRPPLMVRAARIGAEHYDRARVLRLLLGVQSPPAPAPALRRLIEIEAGEEQDRKTRAAHYSAARHVTVLIALMGEARSLAEAPAPAPQPNASRIPALRCAT
ncbi:MAG: hypothetical protein CVT70_12105 [Alphaproteobacteria bacterium HGW-Alphaproteobacteria-1]|jgi:hypothetical protein|nr:MAG: hypothetical protein CVT70_12105 [Alphaproteobacteria bacterium HGW-Alphaproteobacteria-1]